ncbi:hypothetical protein Calab_2982 [Caldithrix abyssi DSM 13497]|uniref:Uncharacterized protein n=1 Tax=Caldithrix abyssi DSM 13497 TaxID=880073 RepID=H1XSP1_CALAY|nr:hypothetical protein Cabys_1852 [Caldithrix abyssi DSM 13497]EHO42589.1 hypothetical protein Calab_2982 [Caldithrix abyssi DSM 13497]
MKFYNRATKLKQLNETFEILIFPRQHSRTQKHFKRDFSNP